MAAPSIANSEEEHDLLVRIDEAAREIFEEAFVEYAKRLGLNAIYIKASTNIVGSNSVNVNVVSVVLRGVGHTLFSVLFLRNYEVDLLDEWLEETYGEALEITGNVDADLEFEAYAIRLSEGISLGDESDFDLLNEITVNADDLAVKALYLYAEACDGAMPQKISLYSLPIDDTCDDCGSPMIGVVVVADDISDNGRSLDRAVARLRLHQNQYEDLSTLFEWLCNQGNCVEFVNINRVYKNEEAFVKAIEDLHKDELQGMKKAFETMSDLLAAGLGFKDSDGENNGGGPGRILH